MMSNVPDILPDWNIAPGATIAIALKNIDRSFSQLADDLKMDLNDVDRLIAGEMPISQDLAERLSVVFGNSSSFWTNRQSQYELDVIRLKSERIEEPVDRRSWVSMFPKRDMEKFGWIPESSSLDDRVQSILKFFGVSSVAEWYAEYEVELSVAAFRTTFAFKSNPSAVAAWLRAAEIDAKNIDCAHWNRDRFQKSLPSIRKLTRWKEPTIFVPELKRICARNGVCLVIMPTPKGCHASGATRFLSDDKAMIVMSLRHKTDDQFWFTFFHEVAHLILHEKEGLFLEDNSEVTELEENEANLFAESVILPDQLGREIMNLPPKSKAVIRFAVQAGVSPGVIVGQMQYKGLISFRQLNFLKRRYIWSSVQDRVFTHETR